MIAMTVRQSDFLHKKAALMAFCLADTYPKGIHTATVTWSSVLWNNLHCRAQHLNLNEQVLTSLELLAAPFQGALLRGRAASLSDSLVKVANFYRQSHDEADSGITEVNANILPAIVPLAFLSKESDDLSRDLVYLVRVTHRNARVVASAGLLIGLLRCLFLRRSYKLDRIVTYANDFALQVLHYYAGLVSSERLEEIVTAKNAMNYTCSLAIQAKAPELLAFPSGFDGRDSPEQLVVYAFHLAMQRNLQFKEILESLYTEQPAFDVIAPLYGAFFGAYHGLAGQMEERFAGIQTYSFCARFLHSILMDYTASFSDILTLEQKEFSIEKQYIPASPHKEENFQLALF